jgi:hypothetical protein
MDILQALQTNILSPMVLAFLLGIFSVLIASDLEIPESIYTFLSVYLLLAIGLKGGFELAKSPSPGDFVLPALTAALIGALIPLISFPILRRLGGFDVPNAAALAVHYGAVSSVTLSAAINFLDESGVSFEGFMPTLYAILEMPAILVGLMLYSLNSGQGKFDLRVIHSAAAGKGFLLLGSGVIIGLVTGSNGERQVGVFFIDLFPGMLTLFLLEMGMVVGKQLGDLRQAGLFLIAYGWLMPIFHAVLGITLGQMAGLSLGGSMLLGTLAASASYITAPATVRANIPEAKPSIYLTATLVITFPFNLMLGLPLYFEYARWLAGVL